MRIKALTQAALIGLASAWLMVSATVPQPFSGFNNQIWRELRQTYPGWSVARIASWERTIKRLQGKPLPQQLEAVNDFFNAQLAYQTDAQLWQYEDYWATPFEALIVGAGDCEDYVIGKYMTLLLLGVDPEVLRLMYVDAPAWNQAHMVLIYIPEQGAPLVLDNLIEEIKPANERTDLIPVYSFNAQGFWLAGEAGLGGEVVGHAGVPKWRAVLEKLPEGFNL
ncbi:transglutaminase-like cysteine peptidase [Salinibius halmophilus]|uniref:transglutaminase-like cysteine peptidase n=1 Tax=Salinibius halmophilus TaxID=1853216 RepID=UPI0018F4428C|nr:transglutaminase-like cysteine peptidase [Salinibius halmophilus]